MDDKMEWKSKCKEKKKILCICCKRCTLSSIIYEQNKIILKENRSFFIFILDYVIEIDSKNFYKFSWAIGHGK